VKRLIGMLLIWVPIYYSQNRLPDLQFLSSV
jgi:hypothetical protein